MRRIFLTAGHKGPGTGAKSPKSIKNGIDEGAETIWLRDAIAKRLDDRWGVCAQLDENKTVLSLVVSKIRQLIGKKDICVDIHFNAAGTPAATGTEVFVPHNATKFEKDMAGELLAVIKNTLQIKSRGVKSEGQSQHSKLAMLSGFDAESVLLEICFVSNPNDCAAYYAVRDELAITLADNIYAISQH